MSTVSCCCVPRSILVIKPSSFGDVVHTIPAVARLKHAWPNAHLTWLINPEWSPLLSENRSVDEVLLFPRSDFRGYKGAYRFLRWCNEVLRRRQPDLTIDFQGLLRSAWLGRASRAKCFVGMDDAREGARWFYDHKAPVDSDAEHAVKRYLATVDYALELYHRQKSGFGSDALVWPVPTGESMDLGDKMQEKFVLFHPFARGEGKSMSATEVLQICQAVSPRSIVLAGQYGGAPLSGLPDNCLNLLNKSSLGQLIWLIRKAAFVLTVDSGPAHLAAALQKPMIAIHTWSDPRLVGPYWEKAWVWKNGQLIQVQALADVENSFFVPRSIRMQRGDVLSISKLATSF